MYIADQGQAKSVRRLLSDYSNDRPVGLRIAHGTVDSPRGLKERVPVDIEEVKARCSVERCESAFPRNAKGPRMTGRGMGVFLLALG